MSVEILISEYQRGASDKGIGDKWYNMLQKEQILLVKTVNIMLASLAYIFSSLLCRPIQKSQMILFFCLVYF